MVEITVNLATHNRADFLRPCLESLCRQTIDRQRYEICVVNNASTDHTSTVIKEVKQLFPDHQLFEVFEAKPGLSRARNAGLRATSAPLIADIDDDATAYPDWLENFIRCFSILPPTVGVIGGDIDPEWGCPPPEWLTQALRGTLSATANLGNVPRYLEAHENVLECNSCYRRTALAAVDNFPEELGRVGTLLLCGEGAVHTVMRSRGWQLYFEPNARVKHCIHAERLTPGWLRRRQFWQGVSEYAMLNYYRKHGLTTAPSVALNLPLDLGDWQFINQESTENLVPQLLKFESLGFVMAMGGLIPIDNQ